MLRTLLQACRIGLNRSLALRHVRNRLRFPGIEIDPSVNHVVGGDFQYGEDVAIAEGCNIIVPVSAQLRLGDRCYVGRHVELGPLGTIEIGARTSIQDRSILIGDVRIGRYCMLSLNVLMTSGVHYFGRWPHFLIRDQDLMVSEDPILFSKHSRPIDVGEDCWLGMNAVVMPGVSVGRGCVIGTNAVVTHDLPPYSVAVGVPAKVVKQRLSFVPPRRIDWRDNAHIPYFYCGFRLAVDEREHGQSIGGHVASGRIAIWLDTTGANELRIRARSLSRSEVSLEASGVRESLNAEWKEIRFPVGAEREATWLNAPDGSVAVSEAWTV